mmetsp:Transcript_21288/g.47009  ORF Transcript_21288/g.47009 Transcript_21288/m.47009 type:complete len:214 (+) Transcript_21288:74-715(+)
MLWAHCGYTADHNASAACRLQSTDSEFRHVRLAPTKHAAPAHVDWAATLGKEVLQGLHCLVAAKLRGLITDGRPVLHLCIDHKGPREDVRVAGLFIERGPHLFADRDDSGDWKLRWPRPRRNPEGTSVLQVAENPHADVFRGLHVCRQGAVIKAADHHRAQKGLSKAARNGRQPKGHVLCQGRHHIQAHRESRDLENARRVLRVPLHQAAPDH